MIKYTQKNLRRQEVKTVIVQHLSSPAYQLFCECGDFIAMITDKKFDKRKLYRGNFCKNRFCPMCAWRKAKKDAYKLDILMKYIKQEHKKDFVFLTLTAPNVSGESLVAEITKFNKAFGRLVKRKEVVPIIKGYVRKLEITYNEERNDYHPHFHVLIAVNQSYFSDKTYLKRDRWLELWQEVTGDKTITQVDVRRLKKNGGKEVNEIAAYAAKDSDYASSQEVFDFFYKALKGRQVLTYNGLFADANKLFKQKKLDHLRDIDKTEYVYMLLYNWGFKEYVESERRELTQDEYKKVNGQLFDEMDVDE